VESSFFHIKRSNIPTWTEVISYYSKHGSLYCTMLDATKAFDRVN